jgi:dihydroorotate dehydrogenase electron transfer subunit
MLRVSEQLDPLLARPFGIASVAAKRDIGLFYRVVGKGTTILTAARTGQRLTVVGPVGNGFPLPDKGRTPLLIAGGSGFPPLLSFLPALPGDPVVFLGARDKDCLPPASAIKTFRGHSRKVYIATEDGSAGKRGFVTDLVESFLRSSTDAAKTILYACGPRAMMAAVGRIAGQHAVPCHVSMEERMACGLGVCMGCSVAVAAGGYKRVCKDGPVFESSVIDWSAQVPVMMKRTEGRKTGR